MKYRVTKCAAESIISLFEIQLFMALGTSHSSLSLSFYIFHSSISDQNPF